MKTTKQSRQGVDALDVALNLVSKHWDVPRELILGKSRELNIMNAWHSARYYLCSLNVFTLAEIGALTNCDHATVINSRKKFNYYCHSDKEFVDMKAKFNGDIDLTKTEMLRNSLRDVLSKPSMMQEKVTEIMSIYENR
tara:strand:+ start:300 stop:716 length:417 start_codon:yes stop_codon:yes gene_type:complete